MVKFRLESAMIDPLKRKAHRIELNYEIIRQKLCEKGYVLPIQLGDSG